jgi:hypothetical protein
VDARTVIVSTIVGIAASATTAYITRWLKIREASIAKQHCHTILAAIASNAIGACTGFCTCILHSGLLEVKRNSARAGRFRFRDALFRATKPTLATDAPKHQPFSTIGRVLRQIAIGCNGCVGPGPRVHRRLERCVLGAGKSPDCVVTPYFYTGTR